jgi:hypothetical protein
MTTNVKKPARPLAIRYEVSEELAERIVDACRRTAFLTQSFQDREEMQSWITVRAWQRATETGCQLAGLLARWARQEFFTHRRKNRRNWTLTATSKVPIRANWTMEQDTRMDRETFAKHLTPSENKFLAAIEAGYTQNETRAKNGARSIRVKAFLHLSDYVMENRIGFNDRDTRHYRVYAKRKTA